MTKNLSDLDYPPAENLRNGGETLTVYLAGGFHSGWQDVIEQNVQSFCYLDPRGHSLQDQTQYTFWDLEAIRRSDLIFGYLEPTNPAGYSLAFELGYAKALGKRVILVDEKSAGDEHTQRYMGMVQASADVFFESFDEAVKFMQQLAKVVPGS